MDRIDDLTAFLAIVEKGGQMGAARHLGRSLQSINRSLASLERSVGMELISRTIRRSSPTESGLAFYRRVKPALSEINDARVEASSRRTDLSGLTCIGAPVLFAPAYIVPVICEFLEQHPNIEIDLGVSDRPVDIIEQGLDLSVRIRHLPDSRLKARRVADLRAVVFGSPAYLAKHGQPKRPDQLTQHHCIPRAADDRDVKKWPFRIAGKQKSITVRGRLHTDHGCGARRCSTRPWDRACTPLADLPAR